MPLAAHANGTPLARPRKTRSPPQAFEPTPNDALYFPFSCLPPPVISYPAMIPTSVPARESVPSASPLPLSGQSSRNGTNRVASPLTPPDHGVAQVAPGSVLHPDTMASAASDEWRKLLASARSSFENERRVWEQERHLYQQDIARLRATLDSKQQEMLVMATKLKQAELALGDPNSFHSHIVSPPSAGGSRVSPVKSPPVVAQSGCSVSPPTQGALSRQHAPQTHPGLSGFQFQPARFTVTHHGFDGMATVGGSARMGNIEEEPPSPVSTIAHLSPAPESYRRHAGHTPGAGSFSMETTPGDKTPKAVPPPIIPVEDEVAVQSESGEISEDDEDPAMQEPLFLPPRPDQSEASSMLDALQERLANLSEHPEEQRPAVLQGVPPSETSDSEVDPLDTTASLPVDPAGEDEGPGSAEPQVPGIRLKTKRSYNFGAPIGEMPRRNLADFEDF
ncbi:methyl-binding domain protein 6 [Diplodia corticola]|uniref:Methyl-binding domain protein 6 n=1 Tax=Diplodia corticola TaxID=236234 RepID=A0A1J9RVW6_9PEZI|nr:methyl-binding domain protein 6 [Diplodia corticola]OJD31980.1 methyl-binding domain protein 6 [Diplodia corticola]